MTGVLLGAVAGGWVGFILMPSGASQAKEYWYQGLGSALGTVAGLVGVFLAILVWHLFRAPYRQRNELRDELRRLLARINEPSALPLRVTVERPKSGNVGIWRFKLHNPTRNPVTEVYGKYWGYRPINRPLWRLRWRSDFPSDGMDLPWEGTSQTIGARSSEYLLLGEQPSLLGQPSRTFRHFRPNKKLTRNLNGGTYEFCLEIGSKTRGTPIFQRVRIKFSKRTEFAVTIIPPAANTASEKPQPTPEESPEK